MALTARPDKGGSGPSGADRAAATGEGSGGSGSEPVAGLILLDKPAGWTSHDCVARIRRLAGTKKVGHAGTLDPAATGLLVVGVGRATRLLTYLVGLDKAYQATIRLGAATTTDDAEGQVTFGAPAASLPLEQVLAAMVPWRGRVRQVPSAVSAVKVDGRRSYARVRAGESVDLAAREVVITRFELLEVRAEGDFLDADVVVECSSGTYVRALARDLGASLGVGGHLTELRRLRVGPFEVEEAPALEELAADFAVRSPAWAARRLWPEWRLTAEEARRLAQGQRLALASSPPNGLPKLADSGGGADGIGRGEPGGPSGEAEGREPAGGGSGPLVAGIGPDGGLVGLVRIEGAVARPVAVFA
ncbi:MAG: tRNA pseudouridine(55) synthase TruB [Bifidobacteriaceae bacterium]|jgi:tRNA pseudouridine55 synthase|nr:tRNA pseudouridine(55) synthase TruB [Bifidobacteriaceae bacterium]